MGKEAKKLQHHLQVYAGSKVIGKRIIRGLGVISYTKTDVIGGNIIEQTEGIFEGLAAAAKKLDADAVVNVKIVSGTYTANIFKNSLSERMAVPNTTYLIAYGDAVLTE
jgi:uncharacterized protein YbjQ (UPF0145 family)